MIIWGSRGVTSTNGRGQFHCPSCEQQRPYSKRAVRRFFTLYFVPILPLDRLGEYVECNSCRKQFDVRVLQLDPQVRQQEMQAMFQGVLRDVMLRGACAAGVADGGDVDKLRRMLAEAAGVEMTPEEVRQRLASVRRQPAPELVGDVAGSLNEQGKEILFRATLGGIALGGGEIGEDAGALLRDVAQALQMAPAHVRGIMSEMSGSP